MYIIIYIYIYQAYLYLFVRHKFQGMYPQLLWLYMVQYLHVVLKFTMDTLQGEVPVYEIALG